MSHDFSARISKGVSAEEDAAEAESCQDFRARRPIWPSPSGPSSPGNEAVSLKPVSRRTSSH